MLGKKKKKFYIVTKSNAIYILYFYLCWNTILFFAIALKIGPSGEMLRFIKDLNLSPLTQLVLGGMTIHDPTNGIKANKLWDRVTGSSS